MSTSDGSHGTCQSMAVTVAIPVNKLWSCQQMDYIAVRAMVEVNKVGEGHLTGSGSCVFAMYNTFIEAESAKLLLPDYKEWQMYVAQGCNKSPLHRSLQALLSK